MLCDYADTITNMPARQKLPFACAAMAITCALLWLLGAVLTDRSYWSQWIWWVPQEVYLLACALLTGAAIVLCRGRQRRRSTVRTAAIITLIALTGHTLLIRWRLYNLLIPRPDPTLTLVYWNPGLPYQIEVIPSLARQPADIMILANQPSRTPWQDLIDHLGSQHALVANGKFAVVSRFPMIASGMTSLGLKGRLPAPDRETKTGVSRYVIDPGYARWIELDTSELLGKTTVIWIVDLPSDVALGRFEMTREVRVRLAEWAGPVQGPEPGDSFAPDKPGFPPADIIVGDFNIPRASASLHAITGDLADAYAQSGWGPTATWPTAFPVLHLDQCFLREPLRATSFDVHRPDVGNHMMIEVAITGAPSR